MPFQARGSGNYVSPCRMVGYAIVIQQTDMGDCAVINALPMAL